MSDCSDGRRNQIECHRCGDVITGWCETRRFGFWDEKYQNYKKRPLEQRYCRDCWGKQEARSIGAHFRPESAEQLYDVLAASNGAIAGILCWWSGRPAIRVVDGEVEAAVTKPHRDGIADDGTPILKFDSERIDDYDRETFNEDAKPPRNEDMNLVRLVEVENTPFGALDDSE